MTQRQLETLKSFPDQFIALWMKIGGKYATWCEADLHRMAFEKHITFELRSCFEEYHSTEAAKAIGFFMKLKAGFQATWNKKWMAERDARQQTLTEDVHIIEECFTWEQVSAFMQERTAYRWVDWFFWKKKINGVSYYEKRSQVVVHLTEQEARAEYDAYAFARRGVEFLTAYEPTGEAGWDGSLFLRRFTIKEGVFQWIPSTSSSSLSSLTTRIR